MATTVFFDVFIIKTIGKGHGLTLRPLCLIEVWHIKRKRRAWLRWLYNLLGGPNWKMTYARVIIILRLYLLEQCLNPVLRTSIKTCNFVTFYMFLIHLGMHHTSSLGVTMSTTGTYGICGRWDSCPFLAISVLQPIWGLERGTHFGVMPESST
jgi:hypothetical protein